MKAKYGCVALKAYFVASSGPTAQRKNATKRAVAVTPLDITFVVVVKASNFRCKRETMG